MVTVTFVSVLKAAAPDASRVPGSQFDGNLRTLLEELCGTEGALRSRIFEGEALRRYLNVYVDGRDVRFTGGLETPVHGHSRVDLIPAVSGG